MWLALLSSSVKAEMLILMKSLVEARSADPPFTGAGHLTPACQPLDLPGVTIVDALGSCPPGSVGGTQVANCTLPGHE